MIMRHLRPATTLLGVCTMACGGVAHQAVRQDTTFAATPSAAVAPFDSHRALDLDRYVTPQFVADHGTCIATGTPPSRSRLLYVLAPDSSTYLRLNVGTPPDGSRPDMIDLARGIGGSRIWYATLERGSRVVTTRTFRSQADKDPAMLDLPADGSEGQQLVRLARAAMQLPCTR